MCGVCVETAQWSVFDGQVWFYFSNVCYLSSQMKSNVTFGFTPDTNPGLLDKSPVLDPSNQPTYDTQYNHTQGHFKSALLLESTSLSNYRSVLKAGTKHVQVLHILNKQEAALCSVFCKEPDTERFCVLNLENTTTIN